VEEARFDLATNDSETDIQRRFGPRYWTIIRDLTVYSRNSVEMEFRLESCWTEVGAAGFCAPLSLCFWKRNLSLCFQSGWKHRVSLCFQSG
jgi:hypothetical protein